MIGEQFGVHVFRFLLWIIIFALVSRALAWFNFTVARACSSAPNAFGAGGLLATNVGVRAAPNAFGVGH
jgi:hypothetical protein